MWAIAKDACNWHENDAYDADGYQLSAVAHFKDDPGPQQIELLLNAERPKVTQP